ncbi:MAG: ArsO family NAD(P)H-dependent flavin-containing monooxygenase [Gammaproteobacteria bacterium]|nr:ArsO family NAD(P)H-dependent flavin-containing monooxygenase [Gammaproteobacteria bacterium]MDP2140562.1 ArsO family NAD(P)H-dependent flavin-containing monooxygenase [Gammaproteobacteria bacterium]MDP2347331.1 ArsO family NAD(P)H-dependent flavin-containing monooxygenase [Gammaproteobacteria bacterium]
MSTKKFDVVVIGGGQAALAAGYFLKKANLDFIILDNQRKPGGAWLHAWDSLRLFSPAAYSSLPGLMMQQSDTEGYPHCGDVLTYLSKYERRYELPVFRPHHVSRVMRDIENDCLVVSDGRYQWRARAVVSATGTWSHPFIPQYPGQENYRGQQLHSADYRSPDAFLGQRVLVVGGGNSGAQIFAEVVALADTSWVTQTEPIFLPDEVDGHVLFKRATAKLKGNSEEATVGGIGDIVMVPPVKAVRDKGLLHSRRLFAAFTESGVKWQDGSEESVDVVIWCTGFRPTLEHLAPLGVLEHDGQVQLTDGQADKTPGLWLFGYGNWASPGSATLIGAARSAREIAPGLIRYVDNQRERDIVV